MGAWLKSRGAACKCLGMVAQVKVEAEENEKSAIWRSHRRAFTSSCWRGRFGGTLKLAFSVEYSKSEASAFCCIGSACSRLASASVLARSHWVASFLEEKTKAALIRCCCHRLDEI